MVFAYLIQALGTLHNMADYYEILGISRQADNKDIKTAYKKLALQYHPDKNPDDPYAEENFKKINEAYHVLVDDRKKYLYDLSLQGTDHRQYVSNYSSYSYTQQPTSQYYRHTAHSQARYTHKRTQQYSKAYIRRAYTLSILGFLMLGLISYAIDSVANYYHARWRYEEGLAFMKTQEYNLAFAKFNESIYFDKKYAEPYYERGQILLTVWKGYEKARDDFSTAIRLSPNPPASLYLKRGYCHFQLGEYEAAIVDFSRITADKQLDKEALFFRGNSHRAIRQQDNACHDWKLSFQQGMPEALDSLKKYCPQVFTNYQLSN
jgi:curved DNA-binding protein CbpA